MRFIFVLMVGIGLKFLEKEYSYITLQQPSGTAFNILFISLLIVYVTVTIPSLKRRSHQSGSNGRSFFRLAMTAALLTLLNFLPLLVVENFPYDRSNVEVVKVVVQDQWTVTSGGGAPHYILQTTSWQNSPSERFKSNYRSFSNYSEGDSLSIKLGRDVFGKVRVAALYPRQSES